MEHQSVIVESLADEQTLLEHPAPMGAQHVDGCLVERDRSADAGRLRLADRHLAPGTVGRLGEAQPLRAQHERAFDDVGRVPGTQPG